MEASFKDIISDLKKKIYHPVYVLAGEESYFIDVISDLIEETVLSEQEKEFNQAVLYGRDVDPATVGDYAKRYPMMSNYQVVIIKEAQDMNGIEQLASYIENPLSSTLLVLCHKNKTPDKRRSLYKAIQKNGIYFESKRVSPNKIPDWIKDYMQSLGYTITVKATMLISEFVGNDISKITNEVSKLIINLPKGTEVTDTHVEQNIGISKDYNMFELSNALSTKDIMKANKIAFHLASNKKEDPIFAAVPIFFDFFTKVLLYQENAPKANPKDLGAIVGAHGFYLDQYKNTARLYSRDKLIRIIGYLREYDLKSKGVNNASTDGGELLKELIFKILH
jgi:DNA polymerase III subunit delta